MATASPTSPVDWSSRLYWLDLMHKRLKPKGYGFRHSLFWFCLNLDELDALPQQFWWLSRNRWNFYSFHDADHLNLPHLEALPLKQRLFQYLQEQGYGYSASARALLLTSVRVLGYGFNPVSFFWVAEADGTKPLVVVEVGNTFGEQKLFVVPAQDEAANERLSFEGTQQKHFYVSPFSAVTEHFLFRLRWPKDRLALGIHTVDTAGQPSLVSAVGGHRAPLVTSCVLWFTLCVPFATLKVIALIHWHAFRLWLKRVPFWAKETDASYQRNVLRPHQSLR